MYNGICYFFGQKLFILPVKTKDAGWQCLCWLWARDEGQGCWTFHKNKPSMEGWEHNMNPNYEHSVWGDRITNILS